MVLSPGRRCELVKYFKEELKLKGGKLIAIDMSHYAAAIYFADKHYVIQKDFNNLTSYISSVIEICKKENAGFLMTLIDPELGLLSEHKADFSDNNITLVLSEDDAIKSAFNKSLFYKNYKNILNVIPTYHDYLEAKGAIGRGELRFPVIAKPVNGSASIGVSKISSAEEFDAWKLKKDFIYQNCILGKEIGVDAYFDMISGKIVSLFMKEKIAMRAGETDKSVSIFRQDVLEEVRKLEIGKQYKGPVDIDMFLSEDGRIYTLEINPRFGGGYAHAHYCGANFVKLVVNNINGIENKIDIGTYRLGIAMMKANRFIFKSGDIIHEE